MNVGDSDSDGVPADRGTSGMPEGPGGPPGAPAASEHPPEPRHLRRVLTIWVVLSVILMVATVLVIPLINPVSASSVDGFANLTVLVFTVLAVPVALFVWVFIFYSVISFRVERRRSLDGSDDGPPLQAKPGHQIAWLGVTGTLALTLVVWGLFGLYQTDVPAATVTTTAATGGGPLVVDVTGQQWLWTFYYPATGVRSRVLELPVGEPVSFRVTSLDVLHGFAIRALGVRMDANPGYWVTVPTVTPNRLGTYAVRCVELCGLYHTYMWAPVKVVPDGAFAAWASSHGAR